METRCVHVVQQETCAEDEDDT